MQSTKSGYWTRLEPPPNPRPRWWRPLTEVVRGDGAIVARYRTHAMAERCARALNAGLPMPPDTHAEVWAWTE